MSGALEAGRIMPLVRELRDRRQSFAFETTLAFRPYVRFRPTAPGLTPAL